MSKRSSLAKASVSSIEVDTSTKKGKVKRSKVVVEEETELNFEAEGEVAIERPSNVVMPAKYSLAEPSVVDKEGIFKIVTYNLASLKAACNKGLIEYLEAEDSEILCLQETKLQVEPNVDDKISLSELYKYRYFWCSTAKKGYSGVAILTKYEPIKVIYGFERDKSLDVEGRVITCEFLDFYLVNCYVPNAGDKLVRLEHRLSWDKAMLTHLNSLEKDGKKVIYCGDLNVAHHPIDLARPKENLRSAGFTVEERESFTTQLTDPDYPRVDVDRHLHPGEKLRYTFFSYRAGARAKGNGWRLDYFIISQSLLDKVVDCQIRFECYGASDHIPSVLWLHNLKLGSSDGEPTNAEKKVSNGQPSITNFFKKVTK